MIGKGRPLPGHINLLQSLSWLLQTFMKRKLLLATILIPIEQRETKFCFMDGIRTDECEQEREARMRKTTESWEKRAIGICSCLVLLDTVKQTVSFPWGKHTSDVRKGKAQHKHRENQARLSSWWSGQRLLELVSVLCVLPMWCITKLHSLEGSRWGSAFGAYPPIGRSSTKKWPAELREKQLNTEQTLGASEGAVILGTMNKSGLGFYEERTYMDPESCLLFEGSS